MSPRSKKLTLSLLRWTVAIAGVWWVVSGLQLHSHVLAVLDPSTNKPQQLQLAEPFNEQADFFTCIDPATGNPDLRISRDQIVNEPDKKKLTVKVTGYPNPLPLLGLDLNPELTAVNRFLLEVPSGTGQWFSPDQVDTGRDGYQLKIPHPRIQEGVTFIVRNAAPSYLWVAILIFPGTFLLTTMRWHELLRVLDIRLAPLRTFALNMVGSFWNVAMPGTTGGDVLKAYYVAKQTHHRTRAVMSVLVDRVIGLLALIVLGGAMASLKWNIPQCRLVCISSVAILGAVAVSLLIFYNPTLHKAFFLDAIIGKLPMQKTVHTAIESLHLYGRRPGTVLLALIGSIPVHLIVVCSAMFSGMAFHLPVHPFYYFIFVPVIVLASSIPISFQGAGVMEYFAILLFQPLGVTVAQAVALTMSIRLVQILWNLTGGIFVLHGGFHVPTQSEQHQAEVEDADIPHPAQPASEPLV
jgi:uncharacterized protein (TIRG00374 family)